MPMTPKPTPSPAYADGLYADGCRRTSLYRRYLGSKPTASGRRAYEISRVVYTINSINIKALLHSLPKSFVFSPAVADHCGRWRTSEASRCC
jgi:hypothetical protein